jgi:hypothetical protein
MKVTVSQEEFRKDPAKYVRIAKHTPVRIVGSSGVVRSVISFPVVPDSAFLL